MCIHRCTHSLGLCACVFIYTCTHEPACVNLSAVASFVSVYIHVHTRFARVCVNICIYMCTLVPLVCVCVYMYTLASLVCVCSCVCSVFYMRRFILLPIFGTCATVCSDEVIAGNKNFFRSVYNCLKNDVTSPGPETCLSRYIAANVDAENNIPSTGPCRDAYNLLVISFVENSMYTCVDPELLPGELPGFDCFDSRIGDSVVAFYRTTGQWPIAGMCTSAQVRTYARDEIFAQILADECGSKSGGIAPVVTACDFCFSDKVFAYELRDLLDNAVNPILADACTVEPFGSDCVNSNSVSLARLMFEKCSGYDILSVGPVCTSSQAAYVETLIPKPYYVFAHCAFNPSTLFCTKTSAYLDHIELVTSVDCLGCYAEFRTELAMLALADVDGMCAIDVFAGTCLAYLADALAAFATCSGTALVADKGP